MSHARRVMVIDDDAAVREILTLALQAEGYAVESARDGAEGLEMLERRRADVVIVDMRMPEVDGARFCRQYADRLGGGPVILMTAMTGRPTSTDLPGVVEAITKPFDLDEVLDTVARVIAAAV
jgi:DNA-binding NtrC family response regulator